MANIPLQSITFPGLSDKYITPTVDATLTQTGAAADAKKTGDEIGAIKNDLSEKADKTEALSAYIAETETGNIVSFTDGADDVPVKNLIVAIEPVQDLHGQSAPYPAGGGKNLFDPSVYSEYVQSDGSFIMSGATADGIKTYIPSALVGQELTFSVSLKIPSGSSLTVPRALAKVSGTTINGNFIETSTYGVSTVTFTPTSTDDYVGISYGSNGSQGLQAKDVQLEKGSSATTFAPYSNICPISGWTGANVTRTGKNFIPNISSSFTSGTVLVDFGKDIKFDSFCFSMLFSGSFANIGAAFIEGKDSANNNTILITPQAMKKVSDDTALTANTVYTKEHVYVYNTRTFYASKLLLYAYPAFTDASFAECQFEEGTRTAYEPYQGDTVSIDWTTEAGTVYGGTLDVVSGVLTVDRKMIDGGIITWSKLADGKFYSVEITDAKAGSPTDGYNTTICSIYKPVSIASLASMPDYSVSMDYGKHIQLRDDRFTDAAVLKNSLSGVPLVYKLAIPQTYQLTPEEVKTVLGQNNIFADTGNVTVQYRADTKLYIDKVLNA